MSAGMADIVSCGTANHGADCLCDVTIGTVTPIRYGIHELDHAALVIKYSRLGAPWRPGDLETLLAGLDRARAISDAVKQSGIVPGLLSTYTATVRRLWGEGHSMIDIPEMLGLTFEDAAAALMSGRTSSAPAQWGEATWLRLEAMLFDGKGRVVIAREMRLPENVIGNVLLLWQKCRSDYGVEM